MPAGRYALIVANDQHDDPKLRSLRSPAEDADALARVLGDPAIGGFEVDLVHNVPEHILRMKVSDFLTADDRLTDDTLLLHFSCHGVKDDAGRLFFASPNTQMHNLKGTALSASWLAECIEDSRSRKILLLLDCCYSGAFSDTRRARAGDAAHPLEPLRGGTGRVVLTATSELEYAWEGDTRSGEPTPSVFTSALIKGLETGEADRDGDQRIAVGELYDYIRDQLSDDGVPQRPGMDSQLRGETLYVARTSHITVVELRADMAQRLRDPAPSTRLGLVGDLLAVAQAGGGEGISARAALAELAADDDSLRVRRTAQAAIDELEPAEGEAPAPIPGPPPADPGREHVPCVAAPAPPSAPVESLPPPSPLWDAARAREEVVLQHDDAVLAVAFDAEGELLATGSRDGATRLWRTATGELLACLPCDDWVLGVAFAPGGRRLATAGRDRTTRVWELDSATELGRLTDELVWDVAFSPDGERLATAGAAGEAHVWDAGNGDELATLVHGASICAVRFSHDGLLLATAGGITAHVWDIAAEREVAAVTAAGPVRAIAFADSRRAVAASFGASAPACLWDVRDAASGVEIAPAGLRFATFDAHARQLAGGAAEPDVRLWARDGHELGRLAIESPPSAAAFSPDGHSLAIASRNGTTRIWTDGPTGT
jgi:hypothetical protein